MYMNVEVIRNSWGKVDTDEMRWEFGSLLETERKTQNAEIWYWIEEDDRCYIEPD